MPFVPAAEEQHIFAALELCCLGFLLGPLLALIYQRSHGSDTRAWPNHDYRPPQFTLGDIQTPLLKRDCKFLARPERRYVARTDTFAYLFDDRSVFDNGNQELYFGRFLPRLSGRCHGARDTELPSAQHWYDGADTLPGYLDALKFLQDLEDAASRSCRVVIQFVGVFRVGKFQ